MRVLLVEDESRVASFIQQGLKEEGMNLVWTVHGNDAIHLVQKETFDLIILDVRLPDLSGIEVSRRIRLQNPVIPILMLTALDAVEDRIRGLNSGADDYLPKPFEFEELLARIRALLRRAAFSTGNPPYQDGNLVLDPVGRQCAYNGNPILLTKKEFDLLVYFMARKNQVLDRDTIHRDVWGNDFNRGTNLIDVYVGYLRRKLEDALCPVKIETARGVGYKYTSR